MLRFTPLLADAADRVGTRSVPAGGGRDDVKVAGRWRSVDRAVDQFGQVIDVFMSARRDPKAARRCFQRAIGDPAVGVAFDESASAI